MTTGQTDAGQSDPYVPLCFAGDTKREIPTSRREMNVQEGDGVKKTCVPYEGGLYFHQILILLI